MKKIFVTKPSLPNLDEVCDSLEDVWSSRVLTNGGKFSTKFEEELCSYLGCKYVSLYSNATMALFAVLQILNKKGGVITSPYTFVATTNSIILSGNIPIFVDIDPENFCLDVALIESKIDSNTVAIMPVYTYGLIPDINEINRIALRNNLLLVYDAAHSFGVKPYLDKYLTDYGDVTIFSFHATKVFNTFEGGVVATNSLKLKEQLDQFKNFGIVDEESISLFGLNCKMSEFNSIIGINQLKYINKNLQKRELIYKKYSSNFCNIKDILLTSNNVYQYNYSYYPMRIISGRRNDLYRYLLRNNVVSRKYFYPLVTDYQPYREKFGNLNFVQAKKIADEIICLPIYPDLLDSEQDYIIELVQDFFK